MKRAIIFLFVLLMPVIASAQCVTQDEITKNWGESLNGWSIGSSASSVVTLECNPCKCPMGDDWELDCASFRAGQRKAERDRKAANANLLERMKVYGICK